MSTGIVKGHHRERGFTLAEILVTTAIFAIIMIAALTVYDRSNQVFKKSTESADMQQSTRIGFEKLVSDLRMAGFDYNRGGVPNGEGQVAQPDEQIEYAGPTAVVFRANFNYNVASSAGNGLELGYQPKNIKGGYIFPYVTTSNDEIIAYVLRSNDSTKNTSSIKFYVDDYQPRAAFPSTIVPAPAASNPSHPEELVTISGIDTTNNNPPYTLYRMTLTDVKTPGALGTPVAENIRSLKFFYYTDATGKTLLTNADGSAIDSGRDAGSAAAPNGNFPAAGTGAIGGDGQFNPDNVGTTTNYADRGQRSLIASIRVNLVGMNATPDAKYVEPNETIAALQNYRQYALGSLVVPRNLGLTGFPEPNFNPPAPPTIVGMCVGYCGAPVIYWQPPATSGDITKYRVEWDTSQAGSWTSGVDITDPTLRSAVLPDDGTSDVSQPRWYRMWSYNDNGRSQTASGMWQALPTNRTKPGPPSGLGGTANQVNQIPLAWKGTAANVTPNQLSCSGAGGSTDGSASVAPLEVIKYRVVRGTTPNFDPDNPVAGEESIQVLGFTSASQPPLATSGANMAWIDSGLNTSSSAPPANCQDYYYRVRALDRCYKQANWNTPNDATGVQSMSDWYPAVGNRAYGPIRSNSSGAAPSVPPTLIVDRTLDGLNRYKSGCPDPQNLTSNLCRITLQWAKTTTDVGTPAAPIGVDWYTITRASRAQGSGNNFTIDPGFGTNGQKDVNCTTGVCTSGFSQFSPATAASYVDTPPMLDSNGAVLEYQYTVAAKNCSLYSGNSPYGPTQAALPPNPQVVYPGCSVNPSIVEAGGTGTGSGDSPQQPWVLNTGDTVSVIPPVGVNVQNVRFDLFAWPGLTQVGSPFIVPTPGPYVFSYADQTDNQIYMLRISVNILDAQGNACQEVHVKYIKDQQQTDCAFASVTPPAPTVVGHGNNPESDSVTFTVSNPAGSAAIVFNGSNPSIAGQITIAYHSPDLTGNGCPQNKQPCHSDLQLTDLVWQIGTGTAVTDSVCAYGACPKVGSGTLTLTRSIPSAITSVPANSTFTVKAIFKFDGTGGNPSLPSSPSAITNLCLTYKISGEPVDTKHCNLVGKANTSANPGSCD